MATITASATGGNWNTNAAWAGLAQPTAADDVLLTATSGNITIPNGVSANCRSIDCTGYTGTLAFATGGGQAILNVGDASGGKIVFVSGMTLTADTTSLIQSFCTSNNGGAGWGVTTGGKSFPGFSIFGGSTGKLVLQDNYTSVAGMQLALISGTLDTNSKTLNIGSFNSNFSNARTLTLGTSTITLTTASAAVWNCSTATNSTISAASSTIVLSGAAAQFLHGQTANASATFGTVNLTGSGSAVVATGASVTFTNLTRTGTASLSDQLKLNTSITVSGTLTLNGNSTINRLTILSSTTFTAQTITCNGSVSASNLNFADITGAGTASWNLSAITGGSGDQGGNSGITFTTPVTRYGVVAGNWGSTATWSATSGGAGGASIPLAQDTVHLDANSGAGTYTVNNGIIGRHLDCTGFTGTLALNSGAVACYGNVTFSSTMTSTGTQQWFVIGRTDIGNPTYTWNGHALSTGFQTIVSSTATINFADNANALYLLLGATSSPTGVVDTGNHNVTLTWTGGSNLFVQGGTLNAGTSTFDLKTTFANSGVSITGGTVNAANATFIFSAATTNSRTFAGNGNTFGALTYTVAGSTGALVITGANTFKNLNFSDASNARTLTFPASTTTTVTTWNVNGTSGKNMTINSSTSGTPATVAKLHNWNIGANSTLVSGNTGLTVAAGDMDFISAKDITGVVTPSGSNLMTMNVG